MQNVRRSVNTQGSDKFIRYTILLHMLGFNASSKNAGLMANDKNFHVESNCQD